MAFIFPGKSLLFYNYYLLTFSLKVRFMRWRQNSPPDLSRATVLYGFPTILHIPLQSSRETPLTL